MELSREIFLTVIYYDFRRGLSRQVCIDQLIPIFGDEALSYATFNAGITNFIVVAIRSPTNFVKIVQNQLLDQETLMLCKN